MLGEMGNEGIIFKSTYCKSMSASNWTQRLTKLYPLAVGLFFLDQRI